MIGNDIVDLALARKESNWRRKGFLDKIFTEKEQLLILNSDNKTIMVWDLWSRKEATYKIYNRQTQIRGYFPLKLECFNVEIVGNLMLGQVHIKDQVFFTKTEINSEFIHTIAVENEQYFQSIKILKNRKNIQKNSCLPSYLENEDSEAKPVSISNHGRFERIISL